MSKSLKTIVPLLLATFILTVHRKASNRYYEPPRVERFAYLADAQRRAVKLHEYDQRVERTVITDTESMGRWPYISERVRKPKGVRQ